MKLSPSQKYPLAFTLALIVLTGAVLLRPYAAVVAAHLPVEPGSRIATLLNRLAGQDQPTRQNQDPTTKRRQTETRTTVKTEGAAPCVLPEYFDQLSSGGQTAKLIEMGCIPPATTIPAQAERVQGPTLESALTTVPVNNAASDLTSRRTQSETALLLAGPNIISAFNDSGSFTANTSPGNHFTGFAVSMDGGATFVDKGTLPNNAGGDLGDPVLARSASTGTVFMATLHFSLDALQIFRSTDNGMTFGAPINGAPGFTPAAANHDKEWITVDNTPGPGYGNVYMAWRNFGTPAGITFTRSTDDGLTWGPSGGLLLENNGQGTFVTVGADHAVYVFYYAAGPAIKMRKSIDQGLTFAPAVTVTPILSAGTNGSLGLEFRSNAFPQAYAHPTNPNILYMTYNDNPAGVDRGDIFFRQSNDGGTTWSAAIRINTDATTNDQFFPSLAIKPDGSALALTWYDRRGDPANVLMERWGRVGTISGTTVNFGPNFVISDVAFPPVFGLDSVVNATYIGDYDQMAADNTYFYTTFLDTRLGSQDVRFAKFTNAGSLMGITQAAPPTLGAGNGDQIIHPDECNTLTFPISNYHAVTATNISGTLTTSTPGVLITFPTSAYPSLTVGDTANNLVPFKISTTADYVCGTTVNLTLTVTSSAGTDILNFTLPGQPPTYVHSTMTGQSIVPGTALVAGSQADDATVVIALPFSYQFYDQNFTSLRADTNGTIQFSSNSSMFNNACLPTTLLNNSLLPFWDDLILTGAGNGIFTSVSGVAPNRIFNIEWRGRHFSDNASSINFEVRLYEGQSRYDFVYGNLNANPTFANGASATVGVQQGTGSAFTQFSCNTASLSSGLKITGAPAPCASGGGSCKQPFTSIISDPLFCTGDSNTIIAHAELGNTNNAPAGFSFTAPIALPLIGIPGACTSNFGTCTLTATSVSVTGIIPANQTLIVDYKVRIANGTAPGTELCVTSSGKLDVDSNGTFDTLDMVTACTKLNCPPKVVNVGVTDQKAGSVLVFPYYNSKSAESKDTRVTISNTGLDQTNVHLFFIDGANCNQADQFVCLTPNASLSINTSEYDPETTGWLLAVAVDAAGKPVQNNSLIGNAFVNDSTYMDNYGAESFWAHSSLLSAMDGSSMTATLFFDGSSYDAVPNQLVTEIQSPLSVTGQKIVTVGMSGDLTLGTLTGAGQVGIGVAYNGDERAASFSGLLTGKCQASNVLTNTIPRVPGTLGGLIPKGQVGTIKLNIGAGVGLIMTPKTNKWSGIRGFHKTGLTSTSITIPVFVPVC